MKKLLAVGCWLLASGACLVAGCKTDVERANDAPGTTKVLMIGNSFSICTLRHLPQVAKDRGVDLDLASLYIGGCTLKRHWENMEKDGKEGYAPYRYDRIVDGRRLVDDAKRNVLEIVRETKWDVITLQQGSHESWRKESYHPYGDKIVAKLRELAPQAKIVLQETWSYTPWDRRLEKWGIDQNEMYAKLHEAYGDFAKQYGLAVIPFGTAVQAWRRKLPVKYTEKSFGGDVVGGGNQAEADHFKRTADNRWVPNGDVFHLGRKGEFFQALVWAKALFDVDLMELDYRPEFVTEAEAQLMAEIATEVK